MRKIVAERLAMGVMGLGIVMVCQPFSQVVFRYGFLVTLAGIVAFTVVGHWREKGAGHE